MNKLFNIYSKLSKPTKASIWFIISNVVLKGISFFTLPIFSRLLTTSEYGIVSVYTSWVSTISIITTLTIWGGVFNVGMVKFQDNYKQMLSAFEGLAIFITMFFFIITLIFIEKVSFLLGISKILVICIFIEILSQIPFNLWATEQRYKYEYKKLVIVTIIIAIVSPLSGILAVKSTTHKIEAKIISNLVIQMIIGIILFIHNQFSGKNFFNKNFWIFGFKFNVVLVPHYLSTQILNQSDRLMINKMCGSSDAGVYSVAYNFALLLSLITNGINSSLTPYIYQCLKDKKTENLKNSTTLIVLIVAIISIGLICFVPDLFKFMLPKSYYPSLKVIPPVVLGAYFLFLYPLFGSIEFYYEENKYITIASVIGAMANIILNLIFIKFFRFYRSCIYYIILLLMFYYLPLFIYDENFEKKSCYK